MSAIPIESLVDHVEEDGNVAKKLRAADGGIKVAYLGPPGTYGHQAARAFAKYLPETTPLVPCSNITSIYSDPSEYLVMPLQNTIHGGVTETLDCLLSSPSSSSSTSNSSSPTKPLRQLVAETNGHSTISLPKIIGSLDLPIRHCLVVKKDVDRLEDIKWVRSHEQALGQSSHFLQTRLPLAKLEQWPSTAGAALSLLDSVDGEDKDGAGAAICSKAVVELHPDKLKVLYEGTQAISNNFTRFLLLTRLSPYSPLPSPSSGISLPAKTTFIALSQPSDLTHLLSSLPSPATLVAIHSRPTAPSSLSSTAGHDPVSSSERYPLGLIVELAGAYNAKDVDVRFGRWLGTTELHADST